MGLIILLLLLALVAYIVIVSLPYKASNIKSLENKLDPDKKSKIDDLLLNEDDFEKEFAKAKKEVDENKKEYTFKGKDGLDIYCESHIVENSKATIVILHGLCEYLPSYDEMVYYFNKMGYSTFGLEHRGHGRSGRLGCDNSQVNVIDFEDYIYDINLFVNDIVKANVNNDLYLYSHSMGGLLAARYLEEYPDDFKKGILSAPMLGIKVGSFPTVVVKAFCGVTSNTFWEKSYAIGEKPFDLDTFKFEDTACVSKARFE